ncbi:MAG: hypothetical protein ACFFD5_12765, partial [Candidatus Thorarchaeota archaeon]
QVKGLIKYSNPKPYLVKAVNQPIQILLKHNALNVNEFKSWVRQTNKNWMKYIILKEPIGRKLLKELKKNKFIKKIYDKLF